MTIIHAKKLNSNALPVPNASGKAGYAMVLLIVKMVRTNFIVFDRIDPDFRHSDENLK